MPAKSSNLRRLARDDTLSFTLQPGRAEFDNQLDVKHIGRMPRPASGPVLVTSAARLLGTQVVKPPVLTTVSATCVPEAVEISVGATRNLLDLAARRHFEPLVTRRIRVFSRTPTTILYRRRRAGPANVALRFGTIYGPRNRRPLDRDERRIIP